MTVVADRMISAWAPLTALEQLLGDEPQLHVDVVAGGAEAVEAAVGDLLGDQDAGHRGPILTGRARRRQLDRAAQGPM